MPRRVRPCVIRGAPTQKLEFPVRTNMIPRQIPDQSWYMQSLFSVLIGGILPFGAVFIELFFILSSVWLNQVRHAHPWRRPHPAWSHPSLRGFGLARAVLLRIWVPGAGRPDLGGYMLRNQHRPGLFPAVQRGARPPLESPSRLRHESARVRHLPLPVGPPGLTRGACTGLQLVVAVDADVGFLWPVPVPVRHLLLLDQGAPANPHAKQDAGALAWMG